MGFPSKLTARRRPVFIADYQQPAPPSSASANDAAEAPKQLLLRYNFPPPGPVALGGESDGYCYRTQFAAGRIGPTYELIRHFLREHGYGNVPIPADVEELRRFRLPPKLRHQLSLFGEDGYVHNPVKILFPKAGRARGALVLELHNEAEPGHLLKFHRR